MYRLHIDISLGLDQKTAIEDAHDIVYLLYSTLKKTSRNKLIINYRLGCDEDRQKSNYLDIDEKGHCSNKKKFFTT